MNIKRSLPNEQFSIHALLAESDRYITTWMEYSNSFLSTLSLRRATIPDSAMARTNGLFYPRSPCGERLGQGFPVQPVANLFYPRSPCGERHQRAAIFQRFRLFSIHALLAESDMYLFVTEPDCRPFLSTLSLRRATMDGATSSMPETFFYPRSPCGERPFLILRWHAQTVFLSTLSLRRATVQLTAFFCSGDFSIHALLAESDCPIHYNKAAFIQFSIHALLAESDAATLPYTAAPEFFYPRSPCGERPVLPHNLHVV